MRRANEAKVKLGELVLDFNLYPRFRIDAGNVAQLAEAFRAGTVIPPPVIEVGTRRVVDGFHRVTLYRREMAEDALIEVIEREYPSEAALFAEAMQLNSQHGQQLSTYDRLKCILLARKMGISDEETAARLHLTVERLTDLAMTRVAIGPDAAVVPLKFTAAALSGRALTAAQLAANENAGGMRPGFYVGQVLNALEGDLIDWSDERLVLRLLQLQEALAKALAERLLVAA